MRATYSALACYLLYRRRRRCISVSSIVCVVSPAASWSVESLLGLTTFLLEEIFWTDADGEYLKELW